MDADDVAGGVTAAASAAVGTFRRLDSGNDDSISVGVVTGIVFEVATGVTPRVLPGRNPLPRRIVPDAAATGGGVVVASTVTEPTVAGNAAHSGMGVSGLVSETAS